MSKRNSKSREEITNYSDDSSEDVTDSEIKLIEEKLATWQHRLHQMQERLKNYEKVSQPKKKVSVVNINTESKSTNEEKPIASPNKNPRESPNKTPSKPTIRSSSPPAKLSSLLESILPVETQKIFMSGPETSFQSNVGEPEQVTPSKRPKSAETSKRLSTSPSPIPPLFSSSEISPFQTPPKKSPARKKKTPQVPENDPVPYSSVTLGQNLFNAPSIPSKNEYRYTSDKLVKSPMVLENAAFADTPSESEEEKFYQQYSFGMKSSSNKYRQSLSGPTKTAEPLVDHSRVPKPERKGVKQVSSTFSPASPPVFTQLDSDNFSAKPSFLGHSSNRPLSGYSGSHEHFKTEATLEESLHASALKFDESSAAHKRSNKVSHTEPSLDDILAQKLQQTSITPKKKAAPANNGTVTISTEELEELIRLRELYEKGALTAEKKEATPKKKITKQSADKTGPHSTYSHLSKNSAGQTPKTINWHKNLRT